VEGSDGDLIRNTLLQLFVLNNMAKTTECVVSK
jgi:hypothetical protein